MLVLFKKLWQDTSIEYSNNSFNTNIKLKEQDIL